MNTHINRIDFVFEGSAHFDVAAILRYLPWEQYQLFLQGGVIHDGTGFIDDPGIVSADFINRISDADSCCMWEILLHIFPSGSTPRPLNSCTDFAESNCECTIYYVDSGDLRVYVKSSEWKDTITKNCMRMQQDRAKEQGLVPCPEPKDT